MSYDITYRSKSLCFERDTMENDAKALFGENFDEVLRNKYHIWGLSDLHLLYLEIGCSNVYESDTNKRARDWMLCGSGEFDTILEQVGIKWARFVENGSLQPNGRYAKAEGWIKKIRDLLQTPSMANTVPSEVHWRLPIPTSWDEKGKIDLFMAKVSDLQVTCTKEQSYGIKFMKLAVKPRHAFELWLVSILVEKHFDHKVWNSIRQECIYFGGYEYA